VKRALLRAALAASLCTGSACGGASLRTSAEAPAPSEVEVVPVTANGNGRSANPRPATEGTFRVSWTELSVTPGCFFFSGPAPHGVRDTLGLVAEYSEHLDVRLSFGAEVSFWSLGGDGPLALSRESHHEFGGGLWLVRERIAIEPVGDGFRGRYHYDEIQPGSTTPGPCHIDAVLTLMP
jgi:hypothetical protein